MTSHDSGGRYPFFPGAMVMQLAEAVEEAVADVGDMVTVDAMIE